MAEPTPAWSKASRGLVAGALLLLFGAPTHAGHAQGVTTAALEGVVSGADSGLEAAEVLVTNLATGERWHATTSRSGRYAFEHLSPGGPYRLDVRAIGFAPATQTALALPLNTRTRLDITLGERVQVLEPLVARVGADPSIGPERMGPERTITDSTLRRLPFRNRDPITAVSLSSVVTVRDSRVSIAGQDPRLTTLQIDGTAAGDLLGGTASPDLALAARPLAVEALQQLEVRRAPYDVRYGSSSVGTVEATTRSGSNRFEGSAWSYYTSRHLQRSEGEDLGPDNATAVEGGLTLGGPLVRDRAAYFVQAGLQHYTVPTAVPVIGSDTTAGADSVGVGFTQASARRLRQILLDEYGFDPGTAERFPLNLPAANVFAKVTWQPWVNSRLEVSHAYDGSTVDFLSDFCRVAYTIYCLTESRFVLPLRTHATRLNWAASLGPRAANELILARRRFRQRCTSADFPTVYVDADAGVLQGGANEACGGDLKIQHILELTDDLTFGLGAHHLTIGTHAERARISLGESSVMPLRASWHFPNLDSLAAGHADRYEAFASNPARAVTSVFTRVAAQQVALYAQDQVSWGRWRVAAGVRADVAFGLKSPTFNPTLLDSLGLDNRRTPGTDIYWGPRIGLSYDVRGDGRLFLRGGMGWFGGRPPFDGATQVYSHTGLDEVHIFCEGSAVPAFTTDRARQPSSCLGALSDPIPGPVVVFEPTYRSPRTFETSIGGDARVPGGLVLTADLTYVRGTRQLSLSERNLLPPIGMSAGEAGRPLFGTIDSAGAIVTARRTGAFERVMALGSQGRSRSMSFTVEAQKQLGAGATLAVSYTYSEARDLLSDTEEDLHAVPDFASGSLRPSGWSAPHRLTLLLAADLPLHFAVSVFYAVQSGTPFTYTIDGDANADGYNNDPIFVPTDPRAGGDVSLVVDDGQGGTVPATDSVYGRFATFIRSQTCLHEQRGRLLARNSCRNTSQSETRARVARVFPLGPRSLTLTMDVFNLFNLLRAQWGQVRGLDDPHLLRLAGYDAARGRGIYEFLPRNLRQSDVQASRWRMQLGATLGF